MLGCARKITRLFSTLQIEKCNYPMSSGRQSITLVVRKQMVHLSRPNNALPPIVALAIRPVLKLTAMLFGRNLRKQWQKLPPDKRKSILQYINNRRSHIAAGFVILSGFGLFYYIEHIEEDSITKRKRFILYKDDQMQSIADLQFENSIAEFKKEVIPSTHPIYGRVVRVANKLLQANKFLPQVKGKNWAVTVIDRPDVTNAFVLPNGKIFVFTGILNVANNDNQLAIVLSHEIAHCLLQHVSENLSKMLYVDLVLLVPLVIMWTILPDAAALFSQWLTSRLAELIIHLPFSRAIEAEADTVGLELAARACYDVREAPVFWGKMDEVNSDQEPLEWFSTHPSNETRQADLSKLIPEALKIRDSCSCPRLPMLSAIQLYYSSKRPSNEPYQHKLL